MLTVGDILPETELGRVLFNIPDLWINTSFCATCPKKFRL